MYFQFQLPKTTLEGTFECCSYVLCPSQHQVQLIANASWTYKTQVYGDSTILQLQGYHTCQYTYVVMVLLADLQIRTVQCPLDTVARDKSILLLFSPIFLSDNSFFLPVMLKILLQVSILFSKLSYIASYLTVTSYTFQTLVGEMLKFDWLLAWVLNHLDPKFASQTPCSQALRPQALRQ